MLKTLRVLLIIDEFDICYTYLGQVFLTCGACGGGGEFWNVLCLTVMLVVYVPNVLQIIWVCPRRYFLFRRNTFCCWQQWAGILSSPVASELYVSHDTFSAIAVSL